MFTAFATDSSIAAGLPLRRPTTCLWRWGVFLVGLSSLALPCFAHDPGLSTAEGRRLDDRIELRVTLAEMDARLVLRDHRTDVSVTEDRWSQLASGWFEASSAHVRVPLSSCQARATPAGGIVFTLVFAVPASAAVTLRATQLPALPIGHREFAVVTDAHDRPLIEKFLTAQDPALALPPIAAPPTVATPALAFVRLGIEHIWTGYDHLLFLFGLLIVCRSFRSIATIISCFTVAHSLTLAAATLNLVAPSSRWVEPTIAASIVFVGLENLFRRGQEPRGRFLLTFAFGLIHGFGFASALRELGVGSGSGSALLPLFTFNVGVEIGQIAIAAVALPLVWRLRRSEEFVRYGVPALSSLVAAAGLYWLLARTVLA